MSLRAFVLLNLTMFAALALVVTGGLAASDSESVRAPRAFTVQLLSRNGSDMVGTARFVPRGPRSFYVVVRITGGPGETSTGYPAHLHYGPCSREPTFANPRIEYGLNYVRSGRSRTIVRLRLASLRRGRHSINVHEPSGGLRPMACGDVPRRF